MRSIDCGFQPRNIIFFFLNFIQTYSIAFRYRQKKSGLIRYLYNNSSHSFNRSASLFDILLDFGILNGPNGSPWNSGILLKKSQVCWKLSGVQLLCSLRCSVLVDVLDKLPKWMPKNPLTLVALFRVPGFLPFVSNVRDNPSNCGIFGQKCASLRIRLSAINGDVVKVFSPWYCS